MRLQNPMMFGATMLAVLLVTATCFAAPVAFPSGETVDLSIDQFNRLKRQQGLYYVSYPQKDLIPAQMTERAVVGIPEELGGGFLIGFPEDFQKGLDAIRTPKAEGRPSGQLPADNAPQRMANKNVQLEFALDGGYRIDHLEWNIAGDNSGNNPNILSELTWEDLLIYQLKLSNTTLIKKRLYLRGYVDYGWIYSGDNQDSDYAGDDRTIEFSRSNNNSDDGDVLDGSLGVGYCFTFGGDRFRLIPLIGYSYHEQNLRITDGHQTIPPLGDFPGLDSTYETQWQGPWTGIDFKAQIPLHDSFLDKWAFFTTLELHYADYYAEADWNLRTDFEHPKSFEHEADGLGVIVKIGANLFFTEHWAMNIAYDFSYWQVWDGTDRVFFSDGTRATTQLNEVIWYSHVFSLGVVCQF